MLRAQHAPALSTRSASIIRWAPAPVNASTAPRALLTRCSDSEWMALKWRRARVSFGSQLHAGRALAMPARQGLARAAQRDHRRAQAGMRSQHAVVARAMLPRRRDQRGQTRQQFQRREIEAGAPGGSTTRCRPRPRRTPRRSPRMAFHCSLEPHGLRHGPSFSESWIDARGVRIDADIGHATKMPRCSRSLVTARLSDTGWWASGSPTAVPCNDAG